MSTPTRRMLGLTVLFALCIAGPVSADLKSDAYERFYNRYVGKWKANIEKSRYIVDGPPKEAPSHNYVAMADKKGIKYNGGAIHLLDGKDHPTSPDRPGSTITREVLDEFTIVTTIKQNGRVTSRNTFVVSPDGKFGAFVVMNIDERGEPLIRSLVYYEKQ